MRRIRPPLLLAATLAVSSLAACRDGGGGGGDDQPTPGGPINVSDVDIRDIQDPAGPVAEGTIVNIRDMQPQTLDSHCSAKPVRYALEMNQGWFAKRGIKAGFKLKGAPFAP
mgnify:CR=1 FL=1